MPGEAGWKDRAGKPEEVCTTNQALPSSAQPAAGCKGKTGCTPQWLRCGSCTVCLEQSSCSWPLAVPIPWDSAGGTGQKQLGNNKPNLPNPRSFMLDAKAKK